ncbi:septation protein SepH [Nocardioides sp. BP30]|uniref:septation protein SepH n=1 Tax=Nocardioides sp. BP30 TaxID=3036374 RepID=UPI002469C06E|nr:septation protein SepH [Nocardioides sp. BP30]WGL53955.1 septation protein SepH [Nocardioides sp. BP30]
MSAEELPLTAPAHQPEQDADTRPVAVTLASVTRDGRRAILVDEQGREFTLELDPRLRPAAPQEQSRRTEVPMESALRPRDIQARIRAGESPEQVAEAARSTVEKIMPFAAPVLAEREHTAERAQKASVRRRPGEASAVRTLGDAVATHLRGFELEPDAIASAVAWDSYRRHDGRWKLIGSYDLPFRAGTAELTFDIPGNYVSLDNDDARWLVGEQIAEEPATVVRDDLEAARLRRLQPAPAEPTAEAAPTTHVEEVEEVDEAEQVSATEQTIETPLIDMPAEAYLFDAPATPEPATREADEPVAEAAPEQPEAEVTAEQAPEAPVRRTKRKGRASVPSWDEIMFGGGPSK